ncbi:MAG: MFS transporter [Sphaerochaetaceae bacterium]
MSKLSKYLAILALGTAGGSIYLIPYIRYVFYDWQLEALAITNTQLGMLSTVYAIGCMLLYIPGGMVSDRLSTKKTIMASLLTTTALTTALAFISGYSAALIIWFLFAFTTTFVFWGSLMKTIRMIGTEEEQGFMFGLYYLGNGLTGALVNTVALRLSAMGATGTEKFTICVLTYAASTFLAAILVYLFVKEKLYLSTDVKINEFKLDQVKTVMKNPTIWVFSFIIFAAYTVGYSGGTMFTPYLTEVLGITPEESGVLSIIRTYIFYILAPVSGYIADKVFKSTSRWFMVLFTVLATLYFGILVIPSTANPTMVSYYTLLPGLFGLALYGISFSIASETKIPAAVMGTAVGIASVFGYSPDFFMWTMFGSWLDKYGGGGYTYVFFYLGAVSVLGIFASYFIMKKSKVEAKVALEQ